MPEESKGQGGQLSFLADAGVNGEREASIGDVDRAWGEFSPGVVARLVIAISRGTPFGRGAARKALFAALQRLHTGPVDTLLWEAPVRLHPWNNVSERKALMRPDRMDAAEHALVADRMARQPSVFVDIGANAGLYSLHAALSSTPGGAVLAIEPNRALVQRFLFNIALARGAGRVASGVKVTAVAVAVGDRDGEGFLSSAGGEGASRLDGEQSGMRVPVRRLKALLTEQGIDRIHLMKIDVEGFEDHVLPPFLAEAPEISLPATIIIEHLSRAAWSIDCIADCISRGYEVCGTTRSNTILARRRRD